MPINAYFSDLKAKVMKYMRYLLPVICLLLTGVLTAQIPSGVYQHTEEKEGGSVDHELKVADGYFIQSVYRQTPPAFIKTLGGFYTYENDSLKVTLEFNSNIDNDGLSRLELPLVMNNGDLILNGRVFKQGTAKPQDLDGQWLFATRGPDTGQERRGDSNPRKTLKFLQDGHFQWIAYHTETFAFSGSGGGTYTAKDGKYVENIVYFSRDNSRVGAQLEFDYELMDGDWHHKGLNSKGKPMFEIWARRN